MYKRQIQQLAQKMDWHLADGRYPVNYADLKEVRYVHNWTEPPDVHLSEMCIRDRRKFEAKARNRNKPGVVLCGSMDELRALAQLNPEIEAFYQKHWDEDILLGCILPWKPEAFEELKAFGDGREELMTDVRGTSCFVIKFGKAGEQLAAKLWEEGKMVYASSALSLIHIS